MLRWFDGRVLCQETKRYLDNFMAVTRNRPGDQIEEHSDDDFDDEELLVCSQNFAEVVRTRMGKGLRTEQKSRSAEDHMDSDPEEAAPQGTKDAFNFAHVMWEVPKTPSKMEKPSLPPTDAAGLEKAFAAAAASQQERI